MKNKLFKLFIPLYIIFNIMSILIGTYLVTTKVLRMQTFSYLYIGLFVINVIMSIVLFFRKKYIHNRVDIFLLLIILFASISTIFAYNPSKALFGAWYRYEGLFTICYYMSIMFLSSFVDKEYKKSIVYSILIFGLIEFLYGLCQKFNLFDVRIIMHYKKRWVTGFTGNPNFFGTLMLLCESYAIGLFMESKNKVINFILIVLFLIGILLSDTLSCVVGLLGIMLFLFIYMLKNKCYKKYLLLVVTLLVIFIITSCFNLTTIGNDLIKTKNEVVDISKGNIDKDYGTGRVEIWKKTIEVVPKYLFHGIGVDCFSNILDGEPIRRNGKFYDKAHNEYLQILITMGIFSLISYLSLHFLILKNGIKSSFKNRELYLILPIIGYLIQAQFNISIIEIAPLFYIGLGLSIDRNI